MNKLKYRNPCLKCGREEKDAFLGACFSCWRDMPSQERRALKDRSRGSPQPRFSHTFLAARP